MKLKENKGVALLSALITIMVISLVAVTSINNTNSQLLAVDNMAKDNISRNASEIGAIEIMNLLKSTGDINSINSKQQSITNLNYGSYIIDNITQNGNVLFIRVKGIDNQNINNYRSSNNSEIQIELESSLITENTALFKHSVQGCSRVALNGSGNIAHYNSLNGDYGSHNTESGRIVTVLEDSDVVLSGNTPLNGDVIAKGNLSLEGSSRITGNVEAKGDVSLTGNTIISGNVSTEGNVSIRGSEITGNVLANGDVTFLNNPAKVSGNVTAGGSVNLRRASNVDGSVVSNSNNSFSFDHQDTCDPLNINNKYTNLEEISSQGSISVGSPPNWNITPSSVRKFDNSWGVNAWVDENMNFQSSSVDNKNVNVLKLDSLNIGSSGELRISGGDVVLFVDGDINLSGSSSIIIDDDSSLKIYSTGKISIGGSSSISGNNNEVLNNNGYPLFSFYTSHETPSGCSGSSCNVVSVGGSGEATGVFYAPNGHVSVGGNGDLFGAVIGKEINISGTGDIIYDEALQMNGPSYEIVTGTSTEISDYKILLWRNVFN